MRRPYSGVRSVTVAGLDPATQLPVLRRSSKLPLPVWNILERYQRIGGRASQDLLQVVRTTSIGRFMRLTIPDLRLSSVPEHEQKDARHVAFLLEQLEGYYDSFEAALELFETSRSALGIVHTKWRQSSPPLDACIDDVAEHNRQMRWGQIAIRDAIMTIHHFGIVLAALRGLAGKCASMRASIESDALTKANDQFLSDFPLSGRVRHSVGHSAEAVANIRALEKNSVDGQYIGNLFQRDSRTVTFKADTAPKAQVLTFRLSRQNLTKLFQIAELALSAFGTISPLDPG